MVGRFLRHSVLIIRAMLSDVNLHYLTLAARCPVSGWWPSCWHSDRHCET